MKAKSKTQQISNYKAFLRQIYISSKSGRKQPTSLRRGVGIAKIMTNNRFYSKVLQELCKNSTYLGLVAPTQFPTSLSSIRKGIRGLLTGSTGDELIWSAAVLSLFKDKLSEFLRLKEDFDKASFTGDSVKAESILDYIQEKFGISIWLIKNRILIKQNSCGLREQKDYVEQVIDTESLSLQAALISYHASIRAEDNITFFDLESELESMDGNVKYYFIYHITPSNLDKIKDPATVLFYEETQSLVDRLLAHISMCQLIFVQGSISNGDLLEALKLSAWMPDKNIQRLLVLAGIKEYAVDEDLLCSYKDYAVGDYSKVHVEALEAIELKAHTHVYSSTQDDETPLSMQDEIVMEMASIITCAGDQVKARMRLQKLSALAPTPSIWHSIPAFLERTNELVPPESATDKEKLSAISNPLDNPKNWDILKEVSKHHTGFDPDANNEISDIEPVKLFKFLGASIEDGIKGIDSLELPAYRGLIYKGHLALKNGELELAENFYRKALESQDSRHLDRVTSYLFQALFAKKDIEGAVNLVVEHCLRNPNAIVFYPLKELSVAALEVKKLKSSVSTAILLHLTSRHVHPKWEKKLSNIHENILAKFGAERPSLIDRSSVNDELDKLIYFLRYVCISRILDDSSAYDSVESIEEERISICQVLTSLDPANKSVYSTEIKDITRNEKLASIWHQFQSSKIYIDEDGLRNFLEPTFKETFNRYLVLRDSPSLNTQAEKLAKALERIINDKSLDFKSIKLPASESESLFNTMVQHFVTAFAANPAYGLDTHLSTAIRHGVFEGHIRTALRQLLCTKSQDEYKLPYALSQKLSQQQEDVKKVERVLVRFTKKVETLIASYLTEYFRIYSPDVHPSGLFIFILTEDIRAKSMAKLMNISDYDDFMNELFSLTWSLTDVSISSVKLDIRHNLEKQIQQAFHAIIESLKNEISPQAYKVIESEVVEARLATQKTIEDITEWFNRPEISKKEAIELDLVLAVALKQIENCYITNKLTPSIASLPSKKIQGRYLSGMVEALFILLQNIIIHSGISNEIKGISINLEVVDDTLTISVTNPIAQCVDIELLKNSIEEAQIRYSTGTGLSKAGTEGGSGLSKIWRIMQYELKKNHRLDLQLHNRSFTAKLTIIDLGLI